MEDARYDDDQRHAHNNTWPGYKDIQRIIVGHTRDQGYKIATKTLKWIDDLTRVCDLIGNEAID